MTTILAIEAATDACSVALTHAGAVTERFQLASRRHAENILPMIDDLLQSVSLSIKQLDAIAFGVGPGSFLGSRLAAGVAQGLAYPHDCPLIPISTLQALAQQAAQQATEQLVISAWDARMGEIYWGCYRAHAGVMQAVVADSVAPPDKVKAALPQASAILIGNAWQVYADALAITQDSAFDCMRDCYPQAKDMLPAAIYAFEQGDTISAELASPVYCRHPVTQKKS